MSLLPNNFLGLPFDPWVREQVNVRQKSLGKFSNIPESDLIHYNAKTPFIRLASSVNVTKGLGPVYLTNSVLQKLAKTSGIPESSISGDQLAKKFILQGGAISDLGGGKTSGLQFGLNDGTDIFNGSYGWGGTTERGFIPLPGITNADLTYYSNGALSKSIINIKCYSKAQFELLDVLYLRPGYTLLLEFGWSQYLDGDGKLQNFPNFFTEPLSSLLNGSEADKDLNQFVMYKKIKEARKTYSGNYDAVYGKISNFNWKFNNDGSYDIQVQLTGMGDLIESLKVNITSPYPDADITQKKATEDAQTQAAGEASSNPEASTKPLVYPPLIANAYSSQLNIELFNIYQTCQEAGNADASIAWSSQYTDYKIPSMVTVDEDGKSIKTENFTIKNGIFAAYGTTGDTLPEQNPQVYIKYGALLAYIQSNLLLYNPKKNNSPLVSFDMNFLDIEGATGIDVDENVILKVGGEFSSDPRVCLIPYTNVNTGDEINIPETEVNGILTAGSTWNYSTYLGRLSQIMINVNYIASVLETANKDESGNINLLQLLKMINEGVTYALGGINKFEVKLNDESTKIKFIEHIPQRRDDDQETSKTYTRFNVYGVKPGIEGSFVRNVGLQANLSGDYASMIIIGSQANSNGAAGNSSTFGDYNSGLVDRIIEEKLSVSQPEPEGGEGENVKLTISKNFNTNINPEENSLFKAVYSEGKLLSETISSLNNHNATHANLIVGELTTTNQLQGGFFLPFNLNLTMDGLSGMKLYQKFLMTDNVLPPSYFNDQIDLQITAINHSINSTEWTTQLNTQSVPAEDLAAVSRPTELKSKVTGQSSSGAPGTVPFTNIVEPPASLDPTSRKRFDAMQSSYRGVFKRDGDAPGMCARWTMNMATAYVEFLRGKTLPSKQIPGGGNANNNIAYYTGLVKLGYTKSISTGISKSQLKKMLNSPTNPWGYGDVVAYYGNNGSGSQRQYGHTQIYVGEINSSKWSTSKALNYGTSFPYNSKNSTNWNLLIFRAPST
jgi:hypothetical protein